MRVAPRRDRREADHARGARRRARVRSAAGTMSCSISGSAENLADGHARVERRERVLEDELHLAAQAARKAVSLEAVTSSPSRTMRPAVGSIRRITSRPTVDLPQPDSPTSASVSPGRSTKDTPSTAFTVESGRARTPSASRRSASRDRRRRARIGSRLPPLRGGPDSAIGRAGRGTARERRSAQPASGHGGGSRWRGLPHPDPPLRGGRSSPSGESAPSSRHQPLQRRAPAAREVAAGDRFERRHLGAFRDAERDSAPGTGSPAAARSCSAPCPRSPQGAAGAARAAAARRGARPCRDAAETRNRSSTLARSTTWPAYMTTTSSQTSATTPRSWVMRMIAAPLSSRSLRISSRICAWIVTSSAVVGSSAMRRSGSQASAIAIMTRWRMPPESRCG